MDEAVKARFKGIQETAEKGLKCDPVRRASATTSISACPPAPHAAPLHLQSCTPAAARRALAFNAVARASLRRFCLPHPLLWPGDFVFP